MTATVAEVMVATLKASGVRRVYGLPGDSLNGFTDALRRDGEITWEHVRHEEAAAFAAAAEAALTGELAVCAGSCGPGNLHLINGLFDANRSRVPVLAIAAQIPRRGDRRRLLPGDPSGPAVPRVQRVLRAGQRPGAAAPGARDRHAGGAGPRRGRRGRGARRGVPRRRSGRRRPVPIRATSPVVRPDEQSLAAAAQVLNDAGGGDDPGRGGVRGGARLAHRAGRGAEGPGRARVPRQGVRRVRQPVRRGDDRAHRVQLRLPRHGALRRPGHAGHGFPLPAVLSPTARRWSRSTCGASRSASGCRCGCRWSGRSGTRSTRCCRCSRPRPIGAPGADGALPAGPGPAGQAGHGPGHRLAAAPAVRRGHLDRLGAADAIFTADVGTPSIWAARYLRMNGSRRLIGSFTHASMANALPQAIGAQAASRAGRSSRCPATAGSRCYWASCSRCASCSCR